jgi:replicative DNA helicase
MYQAIGDAITANKPAAVAVGRRFRDDPGYVELGGWPYWAGLMSQSLAVFGTNYADHLIDVARRRAIMAQVHAAAEALSDLNSPISAAVSLADSAISIATDSDSSARTYTFGSALNLARDRMDRLARGEITPGVMVEGLSDWNDITGGMHGGQFILLGGRPSMGKTALSLGVSLRAALAGFGVLYISREMDVTQLMPRMIADLVYLESGDATFDQIRKGNITPEDRDLIDQIAENLAKLPMEIIDRDKLGAGEVGP